MARPRKTVFIPFDVLFPMLVYYFAQVVDKEMGGEWSADLSWNKLCDFIDEKTKIQLTRNQLESLIYSFKTGVADKRKPFANIVKYYTPNYRGQMEKLRYLYPDHFREEVDGEIILTGEGWDEET